MLMEISPTPRRALTATKIQRAGTIRRSLGRRLLFCKLPPQRTLTGAKPRLITESGIRILIYRKMPVPEPITLKLSLNIQPALFGQLSPLPPFRPPKVRMSGWAIISKNPFPPALILHTPLIGTQSDRYRKFIPPPLKSEPPLTMAKPYLTPLLQLARISH